jgi:hypothetical protein
VRVLFDEPLPRPLARELTGHDVRTAQRQGWAGISNGNLLRRAAEAGFDGLVTGDRNLQFQQNLAGLAIGVVVLATGSTKLRDLIPYVPRILAAIASVRPGEVVVVTP